MATYIMFGRYSQDAIGKISAERTQKATALIEQNGGKLREGYALLGETDLVIIVDLPDTERAMKSSVALSKLLGVSFATMPAISVSEFDRILA
ncbi:MAG TPA: GYD domain-containing protein [Gemmatimonadaceae bacterium]